MKKIISLIALLSLNHCASLVFTSMLMSERKPGYDLIYTGTRFNYGIIFETQTSHKTFSGPVATTICVIDFVPSLVVDTLFAPVTLPWGILTAKKKSTLPPGDQP